jgi:hypothetical protein
MTVTVYCPKRVRVTESFHFPEKEIEAKRMARAGVKVEVAQNLLLLLILCTPACSKLISLEFISKSLAANIFLVFSRLNKYLLNETFS